MIMIMSKCMVSLFEWKTKGFVHLCIFSGLSSGLCSIVTSQSITTAIHCHYQNYS